MNRQRITLALIIVGVVFLGILIFFLTNKSHVKITSVEGAEIYVAESTDVEPQRVGTTTAEYSTRKTGTLYILVSKDGQMTQTSAQLEHRKTQEVSVELKGVVKREVLAEGSLSFMYFDSDFAYGINPETRGIDYKKLGTKEFPDESFATLPYARKIVWNDTKNFVYNTFGQGVQNVVNGEVLRNVDEGEEAEISTFSDFAKYPGKPIALFNTSGIYTVNDFSEYGSKQIAELSNIQGEVDLYSDQKYIYFANQMFEETEEESDVAAPTKTVVSIYDYGGGKFAEIELPEPQKVNKVALVGSGTIAILGENQLYFVDEATKAIEAAPYYFANSEDFVFVSGKFLVLNNKGLWEHDLKSKSYYLLSEFGDGEEYVANSLAEGGKGIVFSSKSSRESIIANKGNKSNIYTVSF